MKSSEACVGEHFVCGKTVQLVARVVIPLPQGEAIKGRRVALEIAFDENARPVCNLCELLKQ